MKQMMRDVEGAEIATDRKRPRDQMRKNQNPSADLFFKLFEHWLVVEFCSPREEECLRLRLTIVEVTGSR
jgi:hypothetical protein